MEILNSDWTAHGSSLEHFKELLEEIDSKTSCEKWDNGYYFFRAKGIRSDCIYGQLIVPGVKPEPAEFRIPAQYMNDIMEHGAVYRDGRLFLISESVITDLAKIASLSGDSMHMNCVERDLFLLTVLTSRLLVKNTAILRCEDDFYRIIALRSERFNLLPAIKMYELETIFEKLGFTFYKYELSDELFVFYMKNEDYFVKITDSQIGASSFRISAGYMHTENGFFATIKERNMRHVGNFEDDIQDEIESIIHRMNNIQETYRQNKDCTVDIEEIYSQWHQSILSSKRKFFKLPSEQFIFDRLENCSVEEAVDELLILYANACIDKVDNHEISISVGNLIEAVICI